MGVNSLPKTVTRQRRDCDFNPGPSAPESSTLTTRLPSHPFYLVFVKLHMFACFSIDTAHTIRGTVSCNCPGVRLSVCLSACLTVAVRAHGSKPVAAGLRLWTRHAEDYNIDR